MPPYPREIIEAREIPRYLDEPEETIVARAAKSIGVTVSDIVGYTIRRRSLDARRRGPVTYRYNISLEIDRGGSHTPAERRHELAPIGARGSTIPSRARTPRPVVIGAGPAGLMAALVLAEGGAPPVLVDRGAPVDQRNRDVKELRLWGRFREDSNICFGEGGAGTYSDGKLFTRIKDPRRRAVLDTLVHHGAPYDILVDAHPHLGSNRMVPIVASLRRALEELGTEVRYHARVIGIARAHGKVAGVTLADGTTIPTDTVILAPGNASRGLFEHLATAGVPVEAKPFAIGVRVEHPREVIDRMQYRHHTADTGLPSAEYRLTAKVDGRGFYSFCMCPGGYVINASSEPDALKLNGMSNAPRHSPWSNGAAVLQIPVEDVPRFLPSCSDYPPALRPLALQRYMEKSAFEAGGGGYHAPAQRLVDLLRGRGSTSLPPSSYRPGVLPCDLTEVLGPSLTEAIRRGLEGFIAKAPGFLSDEALVAAVETGTSSPLTILRDKVTMESVGLPGCYPAGEGAGYAGGIVSSAVDGVRVAEQVLLALGTTT